MDMWKAFRFSTLKPQKATKATILYDTFHVLRHFAGGDGQGAQA
jgi:hypothetical protein